MGGFDFEVIWTSLPYLFKQGMTFTLTLTALAMAGGIFFGTILALMRLSSVRAATWRPRQRRQRSRLRCGLTAN